jgi:biotin operon repressor
MNHAFENEIFHAFRKNEREINKAIKFLQKNGYKVFKEVNTKVN